MRLLNEAMCSTVGGSIADDVAARAEARWPRPGSRQVTVLPGRGGHDNAYSRSTEKQQSSDTEKQQSSDTAD
jgi:hypothetical protein